MTLRRRRQIAALLESTEGTYNDPDAIANARHLVWDPTVSHDVAMFNRTPARASFSPLEGIPGIRSGTVSFRIEVRGSGTLGTAPEVGTILKGCGLRELNMETLTLSGASGAFVHGERILVSAAEVGIMYQTSSAGPATIVVAETDGVFADTNAITGETSGATGTVNGVPAAYGVGYWPDSSVGEGNNTSLSILSLEDGLGKALRGARGTVTLTGNVGEPMFLEISITGVEESVEQNALLDGILYETTIPPKLQNAGLTFGTGDESDPCIAAFSMVMNNTLAMKTCANAAEGVDAYRITDREPTGTFDPETSLITSGRDDWNEWFTGTTRTLNYTIGSTSGNSFEFFAPGVQRVNLTDGDREGIALTSHDVRFTTSSVNAPGDDEFVLIYK